jgi:hypothetical protein
MLGTIVHFVLGEGNRKGEERPAVIVRVWTDSLVNLLVFSDSENDKEYTTVPVYWSGSKYHDESEAPNTWHYANEGV